MSRCEIEKSRYEIKKSDTQMIEEFFFTALDALRDACDKTRRYTT